MDEYQDIVVDGVVVGQQLIGSETAPAPVLVVDRLAFVRRFTPEQWFAGQEAAKTDAQLCYALGLLCAVDQVHLDHPDTINTIGYLVQLGILSAEDQARILATA